MADLEIYLAQRRFLDLQCEEHVSIFLCSVWLYLLSRPSMLLFPKDPLTVTNYNFQVPLRNSLSPHTGHQYWASAWHQLPNYLWTQVIVNTTTATASTTANAFITTIILSKVGTGPRTWTLFPDPQPTHKQVGYEIFYWFKSFSFSPFHWEISI